MVPTLPTKEGGVVLTEVNSEQQSSARRTNTVPTPSQSVEEGCQSIRRALQSLHESTATRQQESNLLSGLGQEKRWDDDGMGGYALYTYEEFLDEYGPDAMERWLTAEQYPPL